MMGLGAGAHTSNAILGAVQCRDIEFNGGSHVPTLFDIWGFVAVPISPPTPFLLPLSPLPSPPSC